MLNSLVMGLVAGVTAGVLVIVFRVLGALFQRLLARAEDDEDEDLDPQDVAWGDRRAVLKAVAKMGLSGDEAIRTARSLAVWLQTGQ